MASAVPVLSGAAAGAPDRPEFPEWDRSDFSELTCGDPSDGWFGLDGGVRGEDRLRESSASEEAPCGSDGKHLPSFPRDWVTRSLRLKPGNGPVRPWARLLPFDQRESERVRGWGEGGRRCHQAVSAPRVADATLVQSQRKTLLSLSVLLSPTIPAFERSGIFRAASRR